MGLGAISWQSKKQSVVALSSAEAEYMSLSIAGCQAIWLRVILESLDHPQEGATTIYCDNKSAIALSRNLVFHGKSKHIRIKYHFIRELVANSEIRVEFCGTKGSECGLLHKGITSRCFLHYDKVIGSRDNNSLRGSVKIKLSK